MQPRSLALWTALIAGLALDQGTKALTVWAWPDPGSGVAVIGRWVAFVHVRNPAAAFGLGADLPQTARALVFGATTVIGLAAIALLAPRLPPRDTLGGTVLGLAVAGVVGNALDRALRGSVVDMIDVGIGDPALARSAVAAIGMARWPVFNVADALLVAALAGFALRLLAADEPDDPDPDATGYTPPS